jgi:hypothetical protein
MKNRNPELKYGVFVPPTFLNTRELRILTMLGVPNTKLISFI